MIGRSPALASAMLVFLLSLGGIPFVLGFWGKMCVFLAAADAGLIRLVFLGAVLAVVASLLLPDDRALDVHGEGRRAGD